MYPYAVNGWTSQALQVSRDYRELEKKYGALTSMMSSHNQFIARLEKKCQCRDSAQSPQVGAKKQILHLPIYTRFIKKDSEYFLDWFFFSFLSEQVVTEPPKSQSNVHLNYSSETNQMTNDVQRDQSALPLEQAQTGGGPFHPPTATSSPTDPSFFSFPVTKTPGRSICKLVSKKV